MGVTKKRGRGGKGRQKKGGGIFSKRKKKRIYEERIGAGQMLCGLLGRGRSEGERCSARKKQASAGGVRTCNLFEFASS